MATEISVVGGHIGDIHTVEVANIAPLVDDQQIEAIVEPGQELCPGQVMRNSPRFSKLEGGKIEFALEKDVTWCSSRIHLVAEVAPTVVVPTIEPNQCCCTHRK